MLLAAIKDPEKLKEFKNSTVKSLDKIAQGASGHEKGDPYKYDRSKSKLNFFLGSPLGSDGDVAAGHRTMDAMKYLFHGAEVNSPSDFTKEGQLICSQVFDPELYQVAKQLKYKMIRIDKFGYDPKE